MASLGASGFISQQLNASENRKRDPAPGNHISSVSLALFHSSSAATFGFPPWGGSPSGTLTQADGWFARPAAVCFAGAVLGATFEGEALLAGVDECVAHGGQVQGPDVGMGWRLWLFAVVGWTRGKTLLDLGRVGSSGPFPLLDETRPSSPLWDPFMSSLPSHTPASTSTGMAKAELTWVLAYLPWWNLRL